MFHEHKIYNYLNLSLFQKEEFFRVLQQAGARCLLCVAPSFNFCFFIMENDSCARCFICAALPFSFSFFFLLSLPPLNAKTATK
jgi:hypothetical protein